MVTEVQTAPSIKREITKDDVLRLIAKAKINNGENIFYQNYLAREYVLGTIGDRGGGKSGSDAVISLVDFGLRGYPVWSNMKIQCDIYIDDDEARSAGLNSGGVVHLESLPIYKDELLKLDETYRKGCLVIEEINVQYSNVRRFMTNTNIDFNEVCQQLRKFETSLIYNVIDEMFIDSQLRALTDIFIRTYDTAFDLEAMARKKNTGIDFCWQVYPTSGYLNGEQGRYERTHKYIKAYFHFTPWRGVYDSMRHQVKGTYSLNKREKAAAEKEGFSVESSDELEKEINEWHWLIDKVRELKNTNIEYLEASQLWQVLQIVENGKTPIQMGNILPSFGIQRHHQSTNGKWVYKIESFSLVEGDNKPTGAAAHN